MECWKQEGWWPQRRNEPAGVCSYSIRSKKRERNQVGWLWLQFAGNIQDWHCAHSGCSNDISEVSKRAVSHFGQICLKSHRIVRSWRIEKTDGVWGHRQRENASVLDQTHCFQWARQTAINEGTDQNVWGCSRNIWRSASAICSEDFVNFVKIDKGGSNDSPSWSNCRNSGQSGPAYSRQTHHHSRAAGPLWKSVLEVRVQPDREVQ